MMQLIAPSNDNRRGDGCGLYLFRQGGVGSDEANAPHLLAVKIIGINSQPLSRSSFKILFNMFTISSAFIFGTVLGASIPAVSSVQALSAFQSCARLKVTSPTISNTTTSYITSDIQDQDLYQKYATGDRPRVARRPTGISIDLY